MLRLDMILRVAITRRAALGRVARINFDAFATRPRRLILRERPDPARRAVKSGPVQARFGGNVPVRRLRAAFGTRRPSPHAKVLESDVRVPFCQDADWPLGPAAGRA